MREILFRGKRVDNGEWVEGTPLYLIHEYSDKKFTMIVPLGTEFGCAELDDGYEVIPETVGQYTGLTDKDGKKIFEGDLLQYMWVNWRGDVTPEDMFEVHFDLGRGGWFPFANGDGCGCCEVHTYQPDSDGYVKNFRVIGNIHDNPTVKALRK